MKELRLEDIQDIPGANAFLTHYTDTLNGKFAVEPGSQADFHQPVPEGLDLRNVFCTEETRVISNDWVIRYKNRFLQLVSQSKLPPAKNKVIVQEHLDGSIHLRYRGMEVKFKEISRLQARPQPPNPSSSHSPPWEETCSFSGSSLEKIQSHVLGKKEGGVSLVLTEDISNGLKQGTFLMGVDKIQKFALTGAVKRDMVFSSIGKTKLLQISISTNDRWAMTGNK